MEFYQNKRKSEFQVGLFSILAVIILLFAYFWFTDLLRTGSHQELKVRFSHAANIEKGSPVTIFGIKKGRVENLKVLADGVLAHLIVEMEEPFMVGTKFQVQKPDLMGETTIDITPGKGEKKLDTDKIQIGIDNITISEMIEKLNSILEVFTPLLQSENVSSIFEEMTNTIGELEELITKFNTDYDKNKFKIETLLKNSADASQQIVDYLQQKELQNTIASTQKTVNDLDSLIIEIQATNQNIKKISENILKKDGSLQRMMQEKVLYENLLRSTSRLDSLLQDIKADPKKYFEIKVF